MDRNNYVIVFALVWNMIFCLALNVMYFKTRIEVSRLKRAIRAFGLENQINEFLYFRGERKQK